MKLLKRAVVDPTMPQPMRKISKVRSVAPDHRCTLIKLLSAVYQEVPTRHTMAQWKIRIGASHTLTRGVRFSSCSFRSHLAIEDRNSFVVQMQKRFLRHLCADYSYDAKRT